MQSEPSVEGNLAKLCAGVQGRYGGEGLRWRYFPDVDESGDEYIDAWVCSGVAGTLSLSLQRRGDMVCMRYCDDGDGVAPEHLDSVFDPFFTTKRGAGGSGLGMYIVYNLATQRLQGEITLQSEPGQGLCVELIFPADLGGEKPLVDSSRDVVE